MNESNTTTEEALEAVLCDCLSCMSVPVSHLLLEIAAPIGGWSELFDELEIRVSPDHLGRASIPAMGARRVLAKLRRQSGLLAERSARRHEDMAARRPIGGGVPAIEGMTPWESMVATGKVVMPSQEFGHRPKPRFLEEEIEAGAKSEAEKKRLGAERAKQRLEDQMKTDLGGKP